MADQTGKGGRLSTHVLDTGLGRPAAGVAWRLYRITGEARELLAEGATNADGRSDQPLLAGAQMAAGVHEIVFEAGAYLEASGQRGSGQAVFLDQIPLRFTIADAGQHYHVPLLLSAYGYSTYRGS